MKKLLSVLSGGLLCAAVSLFGLTGCNDDDPGNGGGSGKTVKVAWSVWTGWMPFKLMEKEGLLKKRCEELGVDVELVEFKGYMDSVSAFSAKKVDACAMTSMEALQPASSGVPTVAVIVNDISNGGDGLLVREGMDFASLKGQEIMLEQFSVSHYLLARALEENGMSEADVTIKNIPGDDAGKAFLTDESVKAVTTWNPHLFLAQEGKKGIVLFDSSNIPGEIIDLLVFNGDLMKENPDAVKAVVLAWYDAMALIEGADTKEAAIATMAEGAGASVEEFKKMLGGTNLYTDSGKAVEFFKSADLPETMKKIRAFSFKQELITDEDFEIGFGADSAALLKFDSTFAEQIGN
ncbi:MAG: ABC transporter substrate-binding protein [Verrucomicrobiales bacterium]|nr:ABC transporter substrate-binding protein [Verrucomicrobiales bacterium]